MWDVTLRILSVIGIIALLLLGLLLLLVLLFLFCPLGYRLQGKKTPEELWAFARVSWLFGMLRLCFSYPDPGALTVKVLWMTVFDSSKRKKKPEKAEKTKKAEKTAGSEKQEDRKPANGSGPTPEIPKDGTKTGGEISGPEAAASEEEGGFPENGASEGKGASAENGASEEKGFLAENGASEGKEGSAGNGTSAEKAAASENETPAEEAGSPASDESSGILEKIGKIKYTIQKNCDKIKEIWENLSYYARLCQEENTVRLWRHVMLRLAKILKSVRPRKIRAELLFGAAAPDTTGRVYGLYCMLLPTLGESVVVTPDFTRAVLQGEAELSGHITGGVLAWNGLKLLFDRKLYVFLKKIKAGRKRDGR